MAEKNKNIITQDTEKKIRNIWLFNSIRSRLILSFVLVGVLFFTATAISYWRTTLVLNFDRKSEELYQPIETHTKDVLFSLNKSIDEINAMTFIEVDENDSTDLRKREKESFIKERWEEEISPSLDSLQRLVENTKNGDLAKLNATFQNSSQKIYATFEGAINLSKSAPAYLLKGQNNPKEFTYYSSLSNTIKNQIKPKYTELENMAKNLIERTQIIRNSEAVLLDYNLGIFLVIEGVIYLIIIILIFVLIRNLINYIIGDLRGIYRYLKDAAYGKIPQIPEGYSREFNIISSELAKLRKELIGFRDFALKVGKGDYKTKKTLFQGKGALGNAVEKMVLGLQKVSEENEIRYWRNNGLALFSEVLRTNADDLQILSERFITELVRYLGAHQGAIFLVESDGREEYLEYRASYAYHQDQTPEGNRLRAGQGLIGQVWKEKEMSYFEEIPEKYFFHISSGLGEGIPRVLLSLPLINNDKVLAVIEIAAFDKIAEYKRDFAQEVGTSLAASLATTRSNEQTKKLLYESQELTKSLKKQEEQVKEKIKELERTQYLMTNTQKELAQKEANLEGLVNNTSSAILAFDRKYNITVINRAMRTIYLADGIVLKEGKNLLDELPKKDLKKHQEEYERALAGEKFEVLRVSKRTTGKSFFLLHYTPIRNDINDIIGASIFIENITEAKNIEIKLKEREAYLDSLMNDTDDAVVSVAKDNTILFFNKEYKKHWKEKGVENIRLGKNIFELYLKEEEQGLWKELLGKAFKGEQFLNTIEKGEFPTKKYIEHWFNPIEDDEGDIIGTTVVIRDITRLRKSERHIKKLLLDTLENSQKMQQQERELRTEIAQYKAHIKELEAKVPTYKTS